MKIKYLQYLLIVVTLVATTNCEEIIIGDEFLSQTPETVGFPMDSIFSSRVNAESVLTKAYSYSRFPHQVERCNPHNNQRSYLMELTDLGTHYRVASAAITHIYPGNYNASTNTFYWPYVYGHEFAFECMRYAYIFLRNVDRVPDMSEELKTIRKGEAHVLIAQRYFEMLRCLGGVPWVDDHYTVETIPNEVERMTVEETVNKIVELLDLAATELPWYHPDPNDYTRMTKASALGLKLKVLLHAARPLFNSDEPYHPDAASHRYCWYGNYSAERWERAEAAGQEFMNALNTNGYYSLIQPQGTTHDDYRKAFSDGYGTRMMGEGNTEALITIIPVDHCNEGGNANSYYGTGGTGPLCYARVSWWGRTSSTLTFHNMFPFADGTPFPEDFDWSNPLYNPWFDAAGNATRDPRLYETMYINGDRYKNRTVEGWSAGNGFSKGRDSYFAKESVLIMRKWIHSYDNATFRGKPTQYSFLRLPEVYLSYAEAINEANGGPTATAYDMVNRVRNRVGLPDLTQGLSQTEFREALIRERAMEFAYEEVAWYDATFWKQTDRLQKRVYGLEIFKTAVPDVWEYEVLDLVERYWWTNWDNKWLLWPFPQAEIDKGYGLVQNPGW